MFKYYRNYCNGCIAEINLPKVNPLPDGANNAHAVIMGMQEDDEILPRKLADLSRRVTTPW